MQPATFERIVWQFTQAETIAAGAAWSGMSPDPPLPLSPQLPRAEQLRSLGLVLWWQRAFVIADAFAWLEQQRDVYRADPAAWLRPIVSSPVRRAMLLAGAVLESPLDQPRPKSLMWRGRRTLEITPGSVASGRQFSMTWKGQTISYTASGSTVAEVTAGLTANWNASSNPTIQEAAATDHGTHVTLKLVGAGTARFDSQFSAAATGGGTMTFNFPGSIVYLPNLFWGGSGASQAWRMTTPFGANLTTTTQVADWFVSGTGRPPTGARGLRNAGVGWWPFDVLRQLPLGEWAVTLWDGQISGGWPGIVQTAHVSAARAQFESFLDGIINRWNATGNSHMKIDVWHGDSEWRRERLALQTTSDYNWYTANASYNPGTTWHADLIAKLDPTTGDYPTLADELYLTNVPGIASWPTTSGEDTYRWNEGVRELQMRYMRAVCYEPLLARFPDCVVGDYEDRFRAHLVNQGVAVQRHNSPRGPGVAMGNVASGEFYADTLTDANTTVTVWFAGVGHVSTPNTPWACLVYDAIRLNSTIAASRLPLEPWITSYLYHTARTAFTAQLALAHALMFTLAGQRIIYWNGGGYNETTAAEEVVEEAIATADSLSEGKQLVPLLGETRGRWDVPLHRNADVVFQYLMHDGLRILEYRITRVSDSSVSWSTQILPNDAVPPTLDGTIRLRGKPRILVR